MAGYGAPIHHHHEPPGFALGYAGSLGLLYSASFLHAGFIGLGALWLASYLGHGGWLGVHEGYGYSSYHPSGGYYDYGGIGGYYDYEDGVYGSYRDYDIGYGRADSERDRDKEYREPDHKKYASYERSRNKYTGHKKDYNKEYSKSSSTRTRSRKNYDQDDYYSYHRKKRSLSASQFLSSSIIEPFSKLEIDQLKSNDDTEQNAEEVLLTAITESDTDSCGLRLVCELSALKSRVLDRDEWEILKFIRLGDASTPLLGRGLWPGSRSLKPFREAGLYGKRGGACQVRYAKCLYTAMEIMNFVRKVKKL